MNVKFLGKSHKSLNSSQSTPGNPVLRIRTMNCLFIASDWAFCRSNRSCLYLLADSVKAFFFAFSESGDREILVWSSFSRFSMVFRAFFTSVLEPNIAGSHSRHLHRSLQVTLLQYPFLFDHFRIPALTPRSNRTTDPGLLLFSFLKCSINLICRSRPWPLLNLFNRSLITREVIILTVQCLAEICLWEGALSFSLTPPSLGDTFFHMVAVGSLDLSVTRASLSHLDPAAVSLEIPCLSN